jgi:hypothetical protein
MSDYVAKAYPAEEIDHGDAVHYKPENSVTDAGLGYEGTAPDTLDSRLQFKSLEEADHDWTGANTFTDISYADTYWDDMRVPVSSVKVQGSSNIPDWGAFLTTLQVLWFDASTMEQVFFAVQMPHSWKEGTVIYPHVHWVPSINGAQAAHRVKWGLEYSFSNIGTTFSTTPTLSTNTQIPDQALVADRHYLNGLGDLVTIGNTISSMLVCRLFRDATADDYTGEAGLLEVDFHYEIDRPGSREESIK